MFRDSRSSRTTLSVIPHPRFFSSNCKQRSSGSEIWKFTHSFPSKDRRAVAAALNLLTVDGTAIKFLPFSWADRSLRQDARNQDRKARVSLAPEIKLGVLLGRSPAYKLLVTWAVGVVPSGLSLRASDMSLDMRLVAVSEERAGSVPSEP
jgi:hypothetical protein